MSAFVGFSKEDADFVEKFAKNYGIWLELLLLVEVEANTD